jgi:hypothetical protein
MKKVVHFFDNVIILDDNNQRILLNRNNREISKLNINHHVSSLFIIEEN